MALVAAVVAQVVLTLLVVMAEYTALVAVAVAAVLLAVVAQFESSGPARHVHSHQLIQGICNA
jgi:hypothetical protein